MNIIDKPYEKLREYTEVLKRSRKIHGLIVVGCQGIGKTIKVKEYLPEHIFLAGRISAFKLYDILNTYPDSIFIIDDPNDIFQNNDSYGLLLQALQTEEVRTVNWQSFAVQKNKLPATITGTWKIVIITNKIPQGKDVLLSRCLVRKIEFSLKERIALMIEFSKMEGISPEIMDYIKILATGANAEKINFRLLLKANEFWKLKQSWKTYICEELEIANHVKVMLDLESQNIPVGEKVQKFISETGFSRRTYFNMKSAKVQ